MNNYFSQFNQTSGVGGGVRLVSYCPQCHSHYNPMAARVLVERDGAHLIHTECTTCGSFILALVTHGIFGMSAVGLPTDMTSEDVMKFKESEEVREDDVLDFYEWIEYDGALRELTS